MPVNGQFNFEDHLRSKVYDKVRREIAHPSPQDFRSAFETALLAVHEVVTFYQKFNTLPVTQDHPSLEGWYRTESGEELNITGSVSQMVDTAVTFGIRHPRGTLLPAKVIIAGRVVKTVGQEVVHNGDMESYLEGVYRWKKELDSCSSGVCAH